MREVSRMMMDLGLDGSLAQAIAERHVSFAEQTNVADSRKAANAL
jgi:hypothetical protein